MKHEARQALSGGKSRQLVLIHSAVITGAAFLVTLLTFFLNRETVSASGLAGLGTRSLFDTVKSLLSTANSIALPFWEAGLIFSAIMWARREPTAPGSLLQGFRRFGPVLRLTLLKVGLLLMVALVCINLGSFLFMMTPWADDLLNALSPFLQPGADLDRLLMETDHAAILTPMIPMMVLMAVLMGLCMVFFMFRFRMADYLILDGRTSSALEAMSLSVRMTRRQIWNLLKLDLSFWWFYLGQLLLTLLCYLDSILLMAGIALPMSPDAMFLLCYSLYLVGQLGLFVLARAQVQTTYAIAYLRLSASQERFQLPQGL